MNEPTSNTPTPSTPTPSSAPEKTNLETPTPKESPSGDSKWYWAIAGFGILAFLKIYSDIRSRDDLGKTLEKRPEQARVLSAAEVASLNKRCQNGDSMACNGLGANAFQAGKAEDARRFFKLACQKKLYPSCANLALTEETLGNAKEAEKWFVHSCDKGASNGCFGMGMFALKNAQTEKARKYFKKACEGGEKQGCDALEQSPQLQLQAKGGAPDRPNGSHP